MTNDGRVLIEEDNLISLRTACVMEVDGVFSLSLFHAPSSLAQQPNIYKVEYKEWLSAQIAYMYHHIPSGSKIPIQGLKSFIFETTPEFKLLWTDSGNSVAVYLNGEPWAFIDEHTQNTYSKGIMNINEMNPWYRDIVTACKVGNPWDQEKFEKTFANALDGYR